MIPRPEHPQPQFERKNWLNLNGSWQFEIDHGCTGRERCLFDEHALNDLITVPFCPESKLSGVEYTDFMRCVWYKRSVYIPESFLGQRVFLHIDACDYKTEVFVNSKSVGVHIGGYTGFCFDITDALTEGENILAICAEDDTRSGNQPAGKQSNQYSSYGCFYTRTTGIWQTVWLEARPESYLEHLHCTTHTDGSVELLVRACNADGMSVAAAVSLEDELCAMASATIHGNCALVRLQLEEPQLWSPEKPTLYELTLTMGEDEVKSYFGLREIWYADHRMYLNGKSIFGRFVLDQGFYPDGIYTAPSDEALENDIHRSMACGFNGARLHQKIFEPRFLYHCDRLGYLVWGEHANWGLDISRDTAWKNFIPEWLEALERDCNHPAIIGWCPFNETQPNQQNELVATVCRITRAIDPTRLLIDCSGWHHIAGCCDMMDCHDYEQNPEAFRCSYAALYEGKPVKSSVPGIEEAPPELCFVSEFGGTRWSVSEQDAAWGYGEAPQNTDEVMQRFAGLVNALLDNDRICAFCYTQLTDVEQEQNGLFTYDRKPKFNVATLRSILTRRAAVEKEI